jgi:hypothetical protein
MTKTRLSLIALASILAGLATGAVVARQLRPYVQEPRRMSAVWADHYATLGAMVEDVDAIVLASVTSTQPGRVVTGGARVLPFTLVNLQVGLAIQGDVGSSITVEQTGGA